MRGPAIADRELLACSSWPSCISGIGARSFSACISAVERGFAAGAAGGCLAGVLAGVGPGMSGGPYARSRGRAALCPALMARPGPPGLPGAGPAPGRWVKNRTARHLEPALLTAGTGDGGPVSFGGPAAIPCSPRSHVSIKMLRVPAGTRDVTIVPCSAAARPGRAVDVSRPSSPLLADGTALAGVVPVIGSRCGYGRIRATPRDVGGLTLGGLPSSRSLARLPDRGRGTGVLAVVRSSGP